LHQGKRSAVGDYSRRPDLAALVLVLTFAAFANAAGMTTPALEMEKKLGPASGLVFLAFVLLLPFLLASACAWLSRKCSATATRWREHLCGMAVLFAPLGVSMWAAHFLFHLVTAALTPWPVLQRLAKDAGLSASLPNWNIASLGFAELPALEILLLNAGCLFTLWLLWKKTLTTSKTHPLLRFLPWAVLACALYAFGIWIVFQPMEMRGTLQLGLLG
jgi:hypothetical protein